MIGITVIALAITALGRVADIWTSSRGIYYATTEKNKLWHDRYGNFKIWHNAITSAALLAGIFVLCLKVDYLWTLYLPFAIGSWYIAAANYLLQRKQRERQTAFLAEIRRIKMIGGEWEDILVAFNPRILVTISDRTWYDLFPWINEEGHGTDTLVKQRLITRIVALAVQSPFEWFPR